METQNNSKKGPVKLFSHSWDLNRHDYQEQIIFNWRYNEVRVDIRTISRPPFTERTTHFNVFVTSQHFCYSIDFNGYGFTSVGRIPEFRFENNRLLIVPGAGLLMVFEEQTGTEETDSHAPEGKPANENSENGICILDTPQLRKQVEEAKVTWIPLTRECCRVNHFDEPFRTDEAMYWVRKSLYRHYGENHLMFRYDLYNAVLEPITFNTEIFTCRRIFDQYDPGEDGKRSFIVCEISDSQGIYRDYFWKEDAPEEFIFASIIGFMKSLCMYRSWKDFDYVQAVFKEKGLQVNEIDAFIGEELSDLGIAGEQD